MHDCSVVMNTAGETAATKKAQSNIGAGKSPHLSLDHFLTLGTFHLHMHWIINPDFVG